MKPSFTVKKSEWNKMPMKTKKALASMVECLTKPIAYGNGTSGGVYHPDCWFKHADEHFGTQRARAFLGNLYYPGAEKKELRGVTCPYCRKGFTL